MITASETLENYFKAWLEKDFSAMYNLCTLTWKESHSLTELKNIMPFKVVGYVVKNSKSFNDVMEDVSVSVLFKDEEKLITCRLIKEISPYKPSISGTWGVNPISLIKGLN